MKNSYEVQSDLVIWTLVHNFNGHMRKQYNAHFMITAQIFIVFRMTGPTFNYYKTKQLI